MPDLLIVPIGGLGASQLRPTGILWWKKPGIIDALRGIPGTIIMDNSGFNEFQGKGIWEFLGKYPSTPGLFIGHSLGVDTAINTARHYSNTVGTVLLAPVWNEKPAPPMGGVLVFRPSSSVFPQADVAGVAAQVIPGTDHNGVAHDAGVIRQIVDFVQKIRSLP